MHPTIAKAQLTSQPQSSLSSFTERGGQSEPEHRRKLSLLIHWDPHLILVSGVPLVCGSKILFSRAFIQTNGFGMYSKSPLP